ncbi:hypothetical protein CARUB_v10021869mg [Capsella rubella]|uniref:Uncharacterized protein n=1 Tax=Capsella rubella TaxID=81985 RepID=R0GFA0_9BRAS|nr:uncharacterized protein At2g29880 [Capsella rubella]XP_006301448.1 uncharacterized protein At2g29880 [Capsella rubella]EOA18093.1 hypothetical protein CARUB_v10006549mg [Capsella rubella]EOA34346.1 hypothetical protein CARUB_v10021869mg [Capsella rubella]
MGDPQEEKCKGQYLPWSSQETKILVRLLVDAVNQNWCDASGSFNKLTVEQRILPALNKECGTTKTYSNYKNRMKILRARHKSFVDLLSYSSGFGWDPETKKFTARQEVWDDYFKGHSKSKHLRDDSFEDFEDLDKIFGKKIATGKNAIGLGDTTEARTYAPRDSEWETQDNYIPQMADENEVDGVEDLPEQVVSSSLGRRKSNEKLPIRKKTRTEGYNVDKITDEISSATGMSSQLFSMIQQRWQKEAEEKQAEEKNNNVWDAIKEIPGLEENERFDAMNLIHQWGMNAGFVSMTTEERFGWIKRSVRKP